MVLTVKKALKRASVSAEDPACELCERIGRVSVANSDAVTCLFTHVGLIRH
jgi:hypothetical protein